MRALITGATGFVGQYLYDFLQDKTEAVYGTSRTKSDHKQIYQMELSLEESISQVISQTKPTHIFHLAGISNVKESWSKKAETFMANTVGTIHLLEAVRKSNPEIKVLTIGSSEEYGRTGNAVGKISEQHLLEPLTPYGASKATVSMLMKQYVRAYGLKVLHARPFNHVGPGQRLGFVTSDFAWQIASLRSKTFGIKEIKVGNLSAVRDFTDVRDIVQAYYLIALDGKSGEIYNVASGIGTKIEKILKILLSFYDQKVIIKKDAALMRPSEIPVLIGDSSKLKQLTGWMPKISLSQSLFDIYKCFLNS